MSKLETLFRPLFKGRLTLPTSLNPAGGQFAGRTDIASGGANVEVLTTAVKSNSIIRYGVQVPDGTATAANSAFSQIVVTSLVDSVGFMFARSDDTARARIDTIMWEIVNTL